MDQTDTADTLARIWLSDPASLRSALEMDDDDNLSLPGSPLEDVADTSPDSDETTLEKQRARLRSYVDKLPYSCEPPEEMDERLAQIVKMIYISARSNHLDLLRSWHGALHTWLLMKYPISKLARINLLRYFYELCVIPSESHLIQERVRMFAALLPHKHDSVISIDWRDLVLDWRPLWRIVKKELWPMKRLMEPSRNVANLYLQLAELSKRFFPGNEVQNILDTILPLLSPNTFLSIIPVLTCFIPLSRPEEYLPALFSIWEALNSNIVDERMIELMAELAEEHLVGTAESSEDESRKDVGIWTERQWFFITGKCLGAMNVPIGSTKGASTTGGHADASGMKNSIRIKKPINKNHALAKLFVYSMSLDGPVRTDATYSDPDQNQSGFLAGCKALDSLSKIVTSAETYFHPSNSGHWTLNLSSFLQRLASEFCKRWKEEEDSKCKTPVTRRLTPSIRRSFVLLLRTPLLLALFAKDPISMGLAQGALRSMAILEPGLVMPSLLERAYGGLEVVNETHRTTAVLSMLSGVALPLVSQRIWRGGQKHLVPFLELCLPGIDLNDPAKTVCATLFICSALQHVKISDLSMHAHAVGILIADDGLSETIGGAELGHLPDGAEGIFTILSKEEERTLARESTSGFADWVTALFRRVFALYENLPEEGGRKNTTGGKTEESVLKSVKNMLDVVCLHLSDPLFDLVLKIVFDYSTSNTKSNAVRAIGQLVACLARAKPQLTIDRFLPFCVRQIKEELKYGASSIRTTSSHAAVPSDTTLHWNISLLRGCLGYGGAALLKHRDTIIDLLSILIDKTKSERGFTGTGRLISRILHTLSGVYPVNSRFVNTSEWDSEEFDKNHDLHWGCFTDAKDVEIEWHVPNDEEVSFILQILERIVSPLLDQIERLLADTSRWTVEVNDFCRYLYAVRSVWSGMPTVILLKGSKRVGDPELKDEHSNSSTLHPSGLPVKAGFILTDDRDQTYQAVKNHRERFGWTIHRAAIALRRHSDGEDHIDAVFGVLKSIDTYLLEYGTSKHTYLALQKNYVMARDVNRMWPRQRENTRLVFLKRAQVYHHARLAAHSINRCRTELDVFLFDDLIEYSLSPYTRVRRQGQSVLMAATDAYPLSIRCILPKMLSVLARGTDPDRMKGALHVLSYKNYRAVIRSNHAIRTGLLVSLLECQHQEKPSVQKLVANVHHDIVHHCNGEEVWWEPMALTEDSKLYAALESLKSRFSDSETCAPLLNDSLDMVARANVQKEVAYEELTTRIVEIAARPATHWRYLQMTLQSLPLRRDRACAPNVAETLFKATTESHSSTRLIAQKGIVKVLSLVKIRSYAKNRDELWFEEWRNPLQKDVSTHGRDDIISLLQQPLSSDKTPQLYIDKITSGFLFWEPALKGYYSANASSLSHLWEEQSRSALGVMDALMNNPTYFPKLLALWSQEADAKGGLNTDIDLRHDNITYAKTIAKMFEEKCLDKLLPEVDSLMSDSNRFSQRAGAETLAGLLRGSKHWSDSARKTLWSWFMARVSNIFGQIKPDTSALWEGFFRYILEDQDPGRNKPLIEWILSLPLDFHGDSAFTMTKYLDIFATLVNEMGIRFAGLSSNYIETFFANADTSYAEIRMAIAQCLHLLMGCEWHLNYPSLDAFLKACREQSDPLQIRKAKYAQHVHKFVRNFPAWKSERLPPPRVSQSQFDKVSMTLLLWMWSLGHSSEASTMFTYLEPLLPEILKMTELNDNNELVVYSSGVLFILSAVTPPHEYIEIIVDQFINTMKESASYKMKLIGLPMLALFFFRNLVGVSEACTARVMEIVTAYLADENIEVREVAKKVLSGLLRSSQRRKILPLRDQFVHTLQKTKLPRRQDPGYADALKTIHSAILGICALIESFPYSVEPWMPPLTEVLAPHASDPPPISAAIRKTASEFKKTHQDTWHVDQQAFNENQLQDLSTMLVGTSYYA